MHFFSKKSLENFPKRLKIMTTENAGINFIRKYRRKGVGMCFELISPIHYIRLLENVKIACYWM